jgi:hypothetical protein
LNVLTESLIWLLVAAPEVLGITRADISELEVPHENLHEVSPVVDAMGQEQREIANDETIVVYTT